MSLIRVPHERLEVIVLSFEVFADVEELPALVLPQITLHVFALKSPHLDPQALEPVVGLELQLSLVAQLLLEHSSRL